jgi:hypothetical protein
MEDHPKAVYCQQHLTSDELSLSPSYVILTYCITLPHAASLRHFVVLDSANLQYPFIHSLGQKAAITWGNCFDYYVARFCFDELARHYIWTSVIIQEAIPFPL